MKLLKTNDMVSSARHSLLFLSENKYLALVFLSVTAINFLFFYTYPINVAAYDNPNYLGMMYSRVSNLMLASGYPTFLMVLLNLFDVPNGKTIYDIVWLSNIQLIQFLFHISSLLCCLVMCARLFNKQSAFTICLVWGSSTLFMAGVNSAAPEWLLGELMVLSFLLSAQAFISTSNKTKIILYVTSWVIICCAYLVKYNALVVFPALALILLFDRKSIAWKFCTFSISALSCIVLMFAFVEFFHYPTTKSRQLNYDHAWVLLTAMPSEYLALPPEQLGINSLRWLVLSSMVPADYSTAGAYFSIDIGTPPNVRNEYSAKYRQTMQFSKNELIDFLKLNPLPSGFMQWVSAIPLYWYFGLPETDALGIATFKESLLTIPSVYFRKIFQGVQTWSAFDNQNFPSGKQTVPYYSSRLELTFGENINDDNGFVKVTPTNHLHNPPISQLYWNPQEVIWSHGVKVFESMASIIMPLWLERWIFVIAMLGVLFSTNANIRFFGLVFLCSILIFSVASYVLLGMRVKEYTSIIPMVAIFYGMGLSSAYSVFRDVLVSKIKKRYIGQA